MDNKYFLTAISFNSLANLYKFTDDIKDRINIINSNREKRNDFKLMLYQVKKLNIQVLMKIREKEIKEKDKILAYVKDEIGQGLIKNNRDTLEAEILYDLSLSETVLNKIVKKMKEKKKKEFDIVAAIQFNKSFTDLLEDDPRKNHRSKHRENSNNKLEYVHYTDKELDSLLQEIDSNVKLSIDIKDELDTIKNLSKKLDQPFNYFISATNSDMNELEIAQVLLAESYKNKCFKKASYENTNVKELISPQRSFFADPNDESSLSFRTETPVILQGINMIESLSEKGIGKISQLINYSKVPFVMICDESKIIDRQKFNDNISKLKKDIIYRDIDIEQLDLDKVVEKIVKYIENKGYTVDFSMEKFREHLEVEYKNYTVSMIKQVANKMIYNQEVNFSGKIITKFKADDSKETTFSNDKEKSGLEKLDYLVGMDNAKRKVKEFISLNKVNRLRKKEGLLTKSISKNIVLKGNAGTGKTSFSRIFAQIMKEEKLIEKDIFIETSRSELIGKYVGHTSGIVTQYFEKSRGGVLFIDEAYSLMNSKDDPFGREAVDALIKNMENYDDVIVILAGYPAEMDNFISVNPGMMSRVGLTLEMNDFTSEELLDIFIYFSKERDYTINKDALDIVKRHLAHIESKSEKDFGNARYVRKLFDKIQLSQAIRILTLEKLSSDKLQEITIADVKFLEDDIDKKDSNVRKIGFCM